MRSMDSAAWENGLEQFFQYARSRYDLLLKRRRGAPPPWSDDPVLNGWRFCNVFREDDRTTAWFRNNIREPLRDDPAVLMAIMVFRWFNVIEVGELLKEPLLSGDWDLGKWRKLLTDYRERGGRITTGAYMVKSPGGCSKIDGLLDCIWAAREREEELLHVITAPHCTMKAAWELIRGIPYQGSFTANEVVVDLRQTRWLENASDRLTWTNPGPGATAGLSQLFYGGSIRLNRHSIRDREWMLTLMRKMLVCSADPRYWPQRWPAWELHTVQFNLCEVERYLRIKRGGQLKRRFNPEVAARSELWTGLTVG